MGQPTRPTQPSIPLGKFGVGKLVVIHVMTWITGVETIKRQAGIVLVVVWL